MEEKARLKFLAVMGIKVWVSRNNSLPAVTKASARIESLESPKEECHDVAKDSSNWQQLTSNVDSCRRCMHCQHRTHAIVGEGNKRADLMFIGAAPDETEDRLGVPFVGASGQLLTEMISAMGWIREDVYLTNIVKCKVVGDPKSIQLVVKECLPYLEQQIQWVNPKIILAVGEVAAKALLASDKSMNQISGTIHDRNEIPLMAILHPAQLLQEPLEKRKTWLDLQVVLNCLKNGVN
ncbi:MAG: uracil-DNA glycosylase [Methylococcales bacterium]|nr:uracil-DNA glycosylase [Methylococcales bacterium]